MYLPWNKLSSDMWRIEDNKEISYFTHFPFGSFRTKMLMALMKKDKTIEFMDVNQGHYITSEIERFELSKYPEYGRDTDMISIHLKNVKMRRATREDLEKDNLLSKNAVEPSIKDNIKELV